MNNTNLILSDIIRDSGISFGTSGARGLVKHFSREVCTAFTQAFVHTLKSKYHFTKVAMAMDNRPSSYQIAKYCAAALKALSIETIFYGVVPTPALAFKAIGDKVPCIMITGSHIPFDRNGLKFYTPVGEISKEEEAGIINCNSSYISAPIPDELNISDDAANTYVSRYVSAFDGTSLRGRTIGIYEHSSAGRDIYGLIFTKLGANVVSLGRSEDFVPIDTEAVSESDREIAKKWCKEYKLDALFSTDGDGDRPLLADENGEWLKGDILGLLAANALCIDSLAVPVSCNSAVEKSNFFKKIKRTKIGSPYVIKAMETDLNAAGYIAGFEANGGFLLGSDIELNGVLIKALPTRDAVLPVVVVLIDALSSSTISSKVKKLPSRFTSSNRLQNIPFGTSESILSIANDNPNEFFRRCGLDNFKVVDVNHIDGARFISDDDDVIHLRPSGNAPELRCYAEASTSKLSEHYVSKVLNYICLLSAAGSK